ncbi:hypothetical protein [Reyranella sp.]|jgi:hypothetical protein|uniref:hypothetical protein n=1 Tax=Reyranella sp. TaxID=1929291 RepID=UPI000BD2C46E|nr:hypothetical protein [Reyranella sp.]OYY37142.1 MAG: hypothetical protein B7Y57_23075 [Rhodospirillales bacterium 35-66-84]OYZ94113.1 MAG: hypothetical protein B7Y08_13310 [Rhodospirillales bacterium 24-66-33]OZB22954.1 MAG: hypothetical protein B7X63_20460 [Rhodospirillales bacterium 39-66-50]HQS17125.1 hypothetical protein [Reyranella sp.]HQT13804.1 hypothetical protein [Reyranella sp.]
MPLHWTIDSRVKLLAVVADGFIQLADLDRLLDVVTGSNILGYRKLFDGTGGISQMNAEEHLTVGVRLRTLHMQAGAALGPLAVVVRDENYWQVARVLGILAVPKRPMRVFKQAHRARAWLDSPSIMARTPG